MCAPERWHSLPALSFMERIKHSCHSSAAQPVYSKAIFLFFQTASTKLEKNRPRIITLLCQVSLAARDSSRSGTGSAHPSGWPRLLPRKTDPTLLGWNSCQKWAKNQPKQPGQQLRLQPGEHTTSTPSISCLWEHHCSATESGGGSAAQEQGLDIQLLPELSSPLLGLLLYFSETLAKQQLLVLITDKTTFKHFKNILPPVKHKGL